MSISFKWQLSFWELLFSLFWWDLSILWLSQTKNYRISSMKELRILTFGWEDWIKAGLKFFQRTCMIALKISSKSPFTLIITWFDRRSSTNNLNLKLDISLFLSFSKVSKNTLNICLMMMTLKLEMNSFVILFPIFIQEFIYRVMKSLSMEIHSQNCLWFKMVLWSFL